jgi:hypothetical protein
MPTVIATITAPKTCDSSRGHLASAVAADQLGDLREAGCGWSGPRTGAETSTGTRAAPSPWDHRSAERARVGRPRWTATPDVGACWGLTRSCTPEVGRQAAGYNDAATRARPAILACGAVRYGPVGPPCVAVLRAGVRRPRRVVARVQAGLAWGEGAVAIAADAAVCPARRACETAGRDRRTASPSTASAHSRRRSQRHFPLTACG